MSHVTGGIFEPSLGAPLESPTVSRTTTSSGPFSSLNPTSALRSDPPQGSQEAVAKPFKEPQPESRGPIPCQSEQLREDVAEVYPHLGQCYVPPPTSLPKKKRKGFKYYIRLKLSAPFSRPSIPSTQRTESIKARGDSMRRRELKMFTFPRNYLLSDDIGGIFRSILCSLRRRW